MELQEEEMAKMMEEKKCGTLDIQSDAAYDWGCFPDDASENAICCIDIKKPMTEGLEPTERDPRYDSIMEANKNETDLSWCANTE